MNYDALMKRLNSSSQYLQSSHMRVTELTDGFAKVEMDIDEQILNIHGFVHGGALFSLADMAAGSASFTTGRDSVTLSGTINYLKPGTGGKLIARAHAVKAGRTTGVYDVMIRNETDDLLCQAVMTVFFLEKKENEQTKTPASIKSQAQT